MTTLIISAGFAWLVAALVAIRIYLRRTYRKHEYLDLEFDGWTCLVVAFGWPIWLAGSIAGGIWHRTQPSLTRLFLPEKYRADMRAAEVTQLRSDAALLADDDPIAVWLRELADEKETTR